MITQAVSIFLDVSEYVPKLNPNYDERGLLGLCFHPNFNQNGRVFIYYSSRPDRDNKNYRVENSTESFYYNCLSEFIYQNGRILYDAEKVILRMKKDLPFHNGGKIGFVPDGYLYITVGDEGEQRDPNGNAQNLNSLFGKILRIDVDGIDTYPYYKIPPDNPFINVKGVLPEIWEYGFRNPWRVEFFDDILIVTDAGFEAGSGQEEVNIVVKGGNYGWNVKEGKRLAPWSDPKIDTRSMIDPIFSYTTADPKFTDTDVSVIIGGYLTDQGDYVCADFSGRLIRLRIDQTGAEVIETASVGKKIAGKIQLYVLTSEEQGPKGTTGEI